MTVAKKATKKITKAPVLAGARTSTATKEAAPPEGSQTVTFLGRQLAVKLPSPQQIVALKGLLGKLSQLNPETATVEQALSALERCNKIIDMVVADQGDKDWLEDGRLDGSVTIENSIQIVYDALEAYGMGEPEADNRAARRARK